MSSRSTLAFTASLVLWLLTWLVFAYCFYNMLMADPGNVIDACAQGHSGCHAYAFELDTQIALVLISFGMVVLAGLNAALIAWIAGLSSRLRVFENSAASSNDG